MMVRACARLGSRCSCRQTVVRHGMTRPSALRSNSMSMDHTALVASGRTNGRRSATGTFLRCRRTHLQSGLGIQVPDPLVTNREALLAELQVNHAGAVAPMPVGNGHNLLALRPITVHGRPIAQAAGTHAGHPQGMALGETLDGHPPPPPRAVPARLPLFSQHLAGHLPFEPGLGEQLLELGVLDFERLEPLGVRHVQTVELASHR
jgi:hypothetical protein